MSSLITCSNVYQLSVNIVTHFSLMPVWDKASTLKTWVLFNRNRVLLELFLNYSHFLKINLVPTLTRIPSKATTCLLKEKRS